MATQVTQCPKCRTSFRVTDAQLSIANGAVRCGSCLHIFNATEHWLGGQEAPAAKPAAKQEAPASTAPAAKQPQPTTAKPKTSAPISQSIQSLDDDPEPAFNDTIEQNVIDNIFDDDIELEKQHQELIDDSPEEDLKQAPVEARHQSIGDSIEGDEDDDKLISDDLDDDLAISDDMLIDDDMEDEDGARFRDTGQQSIIQSIDDDNPLGSEIEERSGDDETGDFSESFLDIDNWEKQEKGVFKDLDELGEDSIGSEDDWAKKLMEDDDEDLALDPEPEPVREQAPAAPTRVEEEDDLLIDDGDEDDDDDILLIDDEPEEEEEDPFRDIFADLDKGQSGESLDAELQDILNERDNTPKQKAPVEDEFILGDEPLVAGERIGNEKLAMLANIEPEPVVFATTRDRGRWIRIGWMAGVVLALLLFAFQYVAFNFDRLARDESYRGLLTSACGIVGCKIPDRDDISLIRSTNLMVRSHPKAPGALVVDAIITNRAAFRQRFPDMELQFTDLSGTVVAARQFIPGEYLSGELEGMTMMPSNQPIHVSLEIVDPGERAVNYQMRLQANKNR